jgi:hypothetical protein
MVALVSLVLSRVLESYEMYSERRLSQKLMESEFSQCSDDVTTGGGTSWAWTIWFLKGRFRQISLARHVFNRDELWPLRSA